MPPADHPTGAPTPRGAPRRLARRAAAWLVLLLLLGAVLRIGGCVDRLFFVPSRQAPAAPEGAEEVSFTAADGVRLHGWLLKPRAQPGPWPVVIHCHGNAGNIESHAPFSDFLVEHGVAVLLFDYRGYGRSDDVRPSRQGLVLDAHAALDFVLTRPDLDRGRIGVLGVSLGGAFASRLAAERAEVRSLALVSAFTGWSDIAADVVPFVGRLLVRRGTDPIDQVQRLGDRPLLLMHGRRDAVIPFRHADELAAAARSAGLAPEFVPIAGADHNDIMEHADAREALGGFYRRTLGPIPVR